MDFFIKNRNLMIIALVAIVNALGYGIVIPILYSYSLQYGLNDFQNGLLFAIFSICQFIATPIIGRMSDKYGRKPLLIASITGTTLSFFLMAFAPNAFFLFLARALDGITAGNIPVASAVISDTTAPQDRAKGFGIIGASFGFGFIFGPAISGLTVGITPIMPFIIAGIISIIAIIITALFLPETNKHRGEVAHGKLFDFNKLRHALFDPNVGQTFVITLFYFFAFSCAIIYGFQPFAYKVLHLTATQIAFLFTLFGVVGLISQLFLVQKFTQLLGLKKSFVFSFVLTAGALLIMFFSRSLPFFILGSIILGLFNGISQTLIPTILSRETDVKSQGSILGLNASYQSIGMILGPIIGGIVATIATPLPFLLGCGLLFFCFLLSRRVLITTHKESVF